MISTKKGVAVISLCAVIVALVCIIFSDRVDGSIKDQMSPRLTEFSVERGKFMASICGASMLEVWEIASSTKDVEKKIGDMKQTENGWELPIPKNPSLVYTYEARAYDEVGRVIDSKKLEIQGRDEMYTLMWGPTETHTKEITIDESFRYNDIEFTITDVTVDNRCPYKMQCVQPGYVVFDYEAKTDRDIRKGRGQSDEDILFDRYIIRIQEIRPLQEGSIKEIKEQDYRFIVDILINTEALSLDTIDQHDTN